MRLTKAQVIWIRCRIRDAAAFISRKRHGFILIPPFAPNTTHYRFYEEGTESGSTPIAAEDTNISRNVDSDSVVHIRFQIQEQNLSTSSSATCDWKLVYSKSGGAYADVTGSSSNIKSSASANLTDGSATTNRATNGLTDPGVGSFVAGEQEESNGIIEDNQLTAANFTEDVWCITLVSADLANGDTIDLRVAYDDGLGYTTMTGKTARVSVTKTVSATRRVFIVS